MNVDFKDQTVLVSGAAHGFGRAIAGAFAVRGANVFACDVVEHELAETVGIVDGRCHGSVVDVTDRRAVGKWVEEARIATGRRPNRSAAQPITGLPRTPKLPAISAISE